MGVSADSERDRFVILQPLGMEWAVSCLSRGLAEGPRSRASGLFAPSAGPDG